MFRTRASAFQQENCATESDHICRLGFVEYSSIAANRNDRHIPLMSDATLATDIHAIATLEGQFRLRSGRTSSVYFDKYRFEAQPGLLRRVASEIVSRLPPDVEVLAGLELGGVPIATAVSLQTGIPTAFVRKKAKDYGTCRAVEGADVSGRRVVLIEDVITTGGAVTDAARLVAEVGGIIVGVVCAIWRGEGLPRIEGTPTLKVSAALEWSLSG